MNDEQEFLHQAVEKQAGDGLLNPGERRICEELARGKAPWSQRAQALLSVDGGASYTDAGEITGLRASQVKYWVDAFRRRGVEIFPEGGEMEVVLLPDLSDTEIDQVEASVAETPKKPRKTKNKKKSKGKMGKASKIKARKKKKKKDRGKKKSK